MEADTDISEMGIVGDAVGIEDRDQVTVDLSVDGECVDDSGRGEPMDCSG